MHNEIISFTIKEIPARFSQSRNKTQPDAVIPMHYHNEIELLRIVNGDFKCNIDGNELILHSGEIIFINSRVPHETFPELCEYDMIQIDTSQLIFSESTKSIIASIFLGHNVPFFLFTKKDGTSMHTVFDNIFAEYRSNIPGSVFYLLSSLHMAIATLIRENILSDPTDIFRNRSLEKLAPVIDYMISNYDKDITIPELAKILALTPGYFCQLFKQVTGKTCIEFLNFIRVHQAQKLINSTQKSITDIAFEVGFSSSSYFDRVFKKITGVSPSFYRHLHFAKM